MSTVNKLAKLIAIAIHSGKEFSDLIVHEGQEISVKSPNGTRYLSKFVPGVQEEVISAIEIKEYFAEFAAGVNSAAERLKFWTETVDEAFTKKNSVHKSIEIPNGINLRFELFQHSGGKIGIVIRPTRPPRETLDKAIPEKVIEAFNKGRKGMLILTGPTASGKTATAYSMLRYIGSKSSPHVVTIEDPIEYSMSSLPSTGAIYTQREVGRDVGTFGQGLKDALRQSLDILLVGEIRDKETAETAILAAESGALVIVTTHGNTIVGALRKLCFLAGGDQSTTAMRSVLAGSLIGVLRQQLVSGASASAKLVCDYLDGTSQTVREHIENGNWEALDALFMDPASAHHQSMNADLTELINAGEIAYDRAIYQTSNPKGLERAWQVTRNNPRGVGR